MTRWEYRTCVCDEGDYARLSALGLDGWEAYSARHWHYEDESPASPYSGTTFYLKRPMPARIAEAEA